MTKELNLTTAQCKALLSIYRTNEDQNCHAENFVLLAKYFGDDETMFLARANINYRERFGYVHYDLSMACYKLINPLYKKLTEGANISL